jgi:hypothetical protein
MRRTVRRLAVDHTGGTMNKARMNRWMAGMGLAFFGGASITANVLSVNLPALEGDWTAVNIAAWQNLPKKVDVDGWAYFWAVLFPIGALAGIEFVSRFTGLHKILRYGVLGLASAVAVISSYLHIVHVLLWYGQGVFISVIGPIAVDGLMILCTMQILSTVHVADTVEKLDTEDKAPEDTDIVLPFGFTRVSPMSWTPLGPVPPPAVPTVQAPRVPVSRPPVEDKAPKDKAPRETKTRGGWDRAEAAKLIMGTNLSNEEIGERVGTGYKTIQRLRREIKESQAMTERA